MDHEREGCNLHKIIRPVAFGESKELLDPFTKTKDKKPIKHFMVNQLQILFERDCIWISEYDEMIIRQLENYQVVKKTKNGVPVFTDEDEHALDCTMLCVLGYVEQYPDIMNTIYDFKPATAFSNLKVKVRNYLEENLQAERNKEYLKDDDWDEPGAPPPKRVALGTKPSDRTGKSYSWCVRGSNTNKAHKRKSW
jgi:hypothetical protein